MGQPELEAAVRAKKLGASINGSRRLATLASAVAGSPYDDPMSRVLGLDSQASGTIRWVAYFLGAVALMQGFMLTARAIARIVAVDAKVAPAQVLQEIQVFREEPPPPPPPAAEPAKPELAPQARATSHEPPPPPAQAAKVLTQEPDPNEPVDLTGNTIVIGNADEYAGGVTTANGTSRVAVRTANTTGAPGNAAAQQAAPPGPDRSRPAGLLAGNTEWNAPWPMEAENLQIDEARVTLQIEVRADGSAASVHVLKDPGNGFGREARKYAMSQRFQPALDHEGHAVATSFTCPVRFSR
jgi:protein TonB